MAKKSPEPKLRKLALNRLKQGIPCVTSAYGGMLAEAAAVCLEHREHASGAHLTVQGIAAETFEVHWQAVAEKMRKCWADMQAATEHGAYGIAFLLIIDLTEYTIIERSCKGTGFDYWLGTKQDELFQKKARLEVSGILAGEEREIKDRVRQKKKQTDPSDGERPAYIAVIEFSAPTARVVKK